MNIVVAGSRVQIFGEDVKTYQKLPVASYSVNFNQMTGFYLTQRHDLEVREEKIYGNHEKRVDKVMRGFEASDRNFGIILSGQKGIGKTLFARVLATRAMDTGLPVITVSDYIPGVANFISSIEQEVIVIFDEFEKTFGETEHGDPQEEMLTLFDGLDSGKKLFVITCNEVRKLNNYLLNRPGRFHYHFVITNPTGEEIREYMTDKLKPEYASEIEKIVNFSYTISMTYDYLRAIAFELNLGYSLEEALNDLNITRTDDLKYDIFVTFANGMVYSCYGINMDLYSKRKERYRYWGSSEIGDKKYPRSLKIEFVPADVQVINGSLKLAPNKVKILGDYDEYDFDSTAEYEEACNKVQTLPIVDITLIKRDDDFIQKYAV